MQTNMIRQHGTTDVYFIEFIQMEQFKIVVYEIDGESLLGKKVFKWEKIYLATLRM